MVNAPASAVGSRRTAASASSTVISPPPPAVCRCPSSRRWKSSSVRAVTMRIATSSACSGLDRVSMARTPTLSRTAPHLPPSGGARSDPERRERSLPSPPRTLAGPDPERYERSLIVWGAPAMCHERFSAESPGFFLPARFQTVRLCRRFPRCTVASQAVRRGTSVALGGRPRLEPDSPQKRSRGASRNIVGAHRARLTTARTAGGGAGLGAGA